MWRVLSLNNISFNNHKDTTLVLSVYPQLSVISHITVEYTDTEVDIAVFTLNKGQHWDIETLSSQWLHITADKPVSVLTCYDQGYFVPSATGRWNGTEFYTYVSDIQHWPGFIPPLGCSPP